MAWLDELLEHTLVLVAHPDDECIAFGGLLQRIPHPLVVFATNGSPEDPYFWGKHGSREAYAALRRREALESMRAAGVKDVVFLSDLPGGERFVDQQLFQHLRPAFIQLAEIVQRRMSTALLTLAYEGGHPDHDSCSFLGAQLAKKFLIPCWEAPLYHRRIDGSSEFQQFIQENGEELEVKLSATEQEAKHAMCRAYASQGDFLNRFEVKSEKLRPQPGYNFSEPPHPGKTNYEIWQWSMTAQQVSGAFAEFLNWAAPKTVGQ